MSMTASMILIGQLIAGAYSGAGVHDTQTGRIVVGEPAMRIVPAWIDPAMAKTAAMAMSCFFMMVPLFDLVS